MFKTNILHNQQSVCGQAWSYMNFHVQVFVWTCFLLGKYLGVKWLYDNYILSFLPSLPPTLSLSLSHLRCCTQAFSSCGEQRLLFLVVHGFLTAVASLVVEHRL